MFWNIAKYCFHIFNFIILFSLARLLCISFPSHDRHWNWISTRTRRNSERIRFISITITYLTMIAALPAAPRRRPCCPERRQWRWARPDEEIKWVIMYKHVNAIYNIHLYTTRKNKLPKTLKHTWERDETEEEEEENERISLVYIMYLCCMVHSHCT